jgi:DNA-binding PadR family transcriptional regulator
MYGQELAAAIREKTSLCDKEGKVILEGYELSRGVLYGSLRSLEELGYVSGEWDPSKPSNKRTRYFYRITDAGRNAMADMIEQNKKSLFDHVNSMVKIKEELYKEL